ncbi:hypothetical protein Vadar_009782 [Vaccinium darrowii]|uniref:Uncharacterized protein n=1 Tax=Vaccinium darrowii TaxID=229202 RepID=A0ACB7YV64_9ERIC|nr:hypothetical protein Vadar_009782 [Vaccinium darrowii]
MARSDQPKCPQPGPWPPAPDSAAMPPSIWTKRTGFGPNVSGETNATYSSPIGPLPKPRDPNLNVDLEADRAPPPPPSNSRVKSQGSLPRKGSSILAQSVPDFFVVVRKENRKPSVGMLPVVMEKSLTPPAKNSKMYGVEARSGGGGSKAVNSGEKRSGGIIMGRKSYACMEELKGFSAAATNAINGENRGGRNGRGGVGKTVLGYRQY